ncbi:protein WEAK CHLOROPLAST MOVEMENT UNDER BLUE LIGHT 1-like [Neltuma alba]|uniref:protein WEAK CHLOROPLAST MOVEMENT UNDER BLUE LIGHT 1-like n=1 Tax=Neltuma alba TaxID=207710 RepID=UPI0010A2ABC0|nr:protein WEAK CHLOROPLAST MOVEMENT UNDER BLUE LIGHT 1-like [Prosopis alba]XP_028759485.1 protein WEAK CHLOROPLAST MOVEMENT UNDER BLUE LIGHT 1-like [Prosopis alba]
MDGVKIIEEMPLSEPSIIVDQAAGEVGTEFSPKPSDHVNAKKRVIDTAAPFQSVKEAVSKFGGTVDWRANRAMSMERIRFAEAKLEKSEENQLPNEDLGRTLKLIDELKLSLEKAQKEEHQAKQDSELMRLKVQEMEQNIENEASIAAKAQLEIDEAMHAAAVSDLKAIEEELESLRKDFASMVIESEKAIKEAEEAVAESKKVEKTVEDLALEFITTKESLESTQTNNLKFETERTRAAMVGDLRSKLDASSSLLLDLKVKLEETKLKQQYDEEQRKELEEVKRKIAKETAEVNYLRVASLSLKSELEEEKSVSAVIRQREEMASAAVASLKDELDRTQSEVALVQKKEKEAREKMIELPEKLEEAAQEADQAKMLAQEAHLRLQKAKEEAEQAKAKANEMESRLLAAQKELEAVKSSEKSAMEASKALQESESARSNSNAESPSEVTLSMEQYDHLCKLAHEANEQANKRILAANSQIDMAKESELRSLMRLEELNQELAERRKMLKEVTEKAEKAKEGKLGVEQELRTWRADQEQRRNASEETQGTVNQNKDSKSGSDGKQEPKKLDQPTNKKGTGPSLETKTKKKKKSLSSKIAMFFSRRKTHPTK